MNLNVVKETLPDSFIYRGKEFVMSYYSLSIYPTKTHPTRSKEIMWVCLKTGTEVYLLDDDISVIE